MLVIIFGYREVVVQFSWIATFLAVADELHFGRAAQRLNIAQPAVSQQIRQLERSVGARLFDRDHRSVRLTDAGVAFVEPCRQILAAVDGAVQQARNAGTGEFGRIRIGYNAGFAGDHFVEIVRAVHAAYPGLELIVDTSRTNTELRRLVGEGRLDVAVVGGAAAEDGLVHHVFATVGLGVVLPVGHRLTGAPAASIDDLRDETFILVRPAPGRTLRSIVEELCEQARFRPAQVIEVQDATSVVTLASAGVGVAFATHPSDATSPATVVRLPIIESPPIPIGIVWRAGSDSAALRNVIDVVRERYGSRTR